MEELVTGSPSCLERLGCFGKRTNNSQFEFRFNRVVPAQIFPREQCLQKLEEWQEIVTRHCKQEKKEYPTAGVITDNPVDKYRYNNVQLSSRVDCRVPIAYSALECDEDLFAKRPNQRYCHLLPPAGVDRSGGDVYRYYMAQPLYCSRARDEFEYRLIDHSNQVNEAREELLKFNNRATPFNPPPTRFTRYPTPGDCCFDPEMHAPGFESAHCLPTAGLRPALDRDIYRYNRVVPMYPPDPCIRPNEGDMLCPSGCGQEKRYNMTRPDGTNGLMDGDVASFYGALPSSGNYPLPMNICRCPVFKNTPPCTSLGPITDPLLQCPCVNRAIDSYANVSGARPGACAPTPNAMMTRGGGGHYLPRQQQQQQQKMAIPGRTAVFGTANYHCQNPYYPSGYICRPVYDRKYLDDCPEQDGPPADTYTFL